jgi:DNA polymerase-3 subunit delta
MKMSVATLKQRLSSAQLDKLYFLFGDEPVQLMKCLDVIRNKANEESITERLVCHVSGPSDWESLGAEINSMSLFSEKRLIEVRMGSKKPDKLGVSVLDQITQNDNSDDRFVIVLENNEASIKKAKWFKSLQSGSIFFESKMLDSSALSHWIVATGRELGMEFSQMALQLFCERVEGNLLVASQELEKLALATSGHRIEEADIVGSMNDSGSFNIYDLTNTLLRGDLYRTLRVVRRLREIGIEPVLIIWAIVRELRALALIIAEAENGGSVSKIIDSARIWGPRKDAFKIFIQKATTAQVLTLLLHANYIDTVIKGARLGSVWDEIEILSLNICDMMSFSKLMVKD